MPDPVRQPQTAFPVAFDRLESRSRRGWRRDLRTDSACGGQIPSAPRLRDGGRYDRRHRGCAHPRLSHTRPLLGKNGAPATLYAPHLINLCPDRNRWFSTTEQRFIAWARSRPDANPFLAGLLILPAGWIPGARVIRPSPPCRYHDRRSAPRRLGFTRYEIRFTREARASLGVCAGA